MQRVKISTAREQFLQLLQEVEKGEEVFITGEDEITVLAKIVPPGESEIPRAVFGFAKGELQVTEDFDAPLEDFSEYSK